MPSLEAPHGERSTLQAWLVRTTGPLAGTRYPIRDSMTLVGRGPQNHILIEDDAKVSVTHLRIRKQGDSYELEDLDSTNGTYVNGAFTKKAMLKAPCSIQLGLTGPQLSFVLDHSLPFEPEQTVETHVETRDVPHLVRTGDHDGILAEALARIRLGRGRQRRDRSRVLLREMIDKAVSRTHRRARALIAGLVAALLVLAGFTTWKVYSLRTEKQTIDKRIREVEALLKAGGQNSQNAD